jgi:hypothetical protein
MSATRQRSVRGEGALCNRLMDGVGDDEITAAENDGGARDPQNWNQKNRHFFTPNSRPIRAD